MASFVLASFVYTYWESDYEEDPALPGPSPWKSTDALDFMCARSRVPGTLLPMTDVKKIQHNAVVRAVTVKVGSSQPFVGQRVGSISRYGWTTL